MAFPLPVTAAQVGTYFVGQYYQLLQNQPDFVHQFYNDASTMLRIDGNRRETANATLQIHQLILSLKYTEIEIQSANSVESWNGGVLVIVAGFVRVKGFSERKKFVETFFLAPQDMGFFVLNDIFQYVDEERIQHHPVGYLPQNSIETRFDPQAASREQVFNFELGVQSKDFAAATNTAENGSLNTYSYGDEHLERVQEAEYILDENFAVQLNVSLHSGLDQLSSLVEEPIVETQKHTYASIVVKGQPNPAMPSQSTLTKPAFSESEHVPEQSTQPPTESTVPVETVATETIEEAYAMEDEVELKSVYVRNVPKTMSASEIAEEFKKFGKLSPNGVAIRTRKEIDECYAFVEFEDMSSVQNAVKESTVQIGQHHLYIEGRRASRYISTRGGRARGGRGRFNSYARGRFGGRGFGRGPIQQGATTERDYHRPGINGYYRQAPNNERSYQNDARNTQNELE